jgi:hypothetical protein
MPMQNIKNYFYKWFSSNKAQEKTQPIIEETPAKTISWQTRLLNIFKKTPSPEEETRIAPSLEKGLIRTPSEIFEYRTLDSEKDVEYSKEEMLSAFENIKNHSPEALAESYQALDLETTAPFKEVQENYKFLIQGLQDKELKLLDERMMLLQKERESNVPTSTISKSELQQSIADLLNNIDDELQSIENQKKFTEDAYTLIKYHSPEMLEQSYHILQVNPSVTLRALEKQHHELTKENRENQAMWRTVERGQRMQGIKPKISEGLIEQEEKLKNIDEAYNIIKFQSPSLLDESYRILELDPSVPFEQVADQWVKLRNQYRTEGNSQANADLWNAYLLIKMRSRDMHYATLGLTPNTPFMLVRKQYADIVKYLDQKSDDLLNKRFAALKEKSK